MVAKGFAYPIVLLLVAALALVSVRALENGATRERRDKEAELLAVGTAYRDAIRDYYDNSPGSLKEYPRDLASLVRDGRSTIIRRPLRKAYRDPVTGGEWALIRTEQGAIKGVYSLSTRRPIKRSGFSEEFSGFADAQNYQQWRFIYEPGWAARSPGGLAARTRIPSLSAE